MVRLLVEARLHYASEQRGERGFVHGEQVIRKRVHAVGLGSRRLLRLGLGRLLGRRSRRLLCARLCGTDCRPCGVGCLAAFGGVRGHAQVIAVDGGLVRVEPAITLGHGGFRREVLDGSLARLRVGVAFGYVRECATCELV